LNPDLDLKKRNYSGKKKGIIIWDFKIGNRADLLSSVNIWKPGKYDDQIRKLTALTLSSPNP
jgi:hypothetical protein